MQCYSDLVPPSAVSNSLCMPLLSAKSNNLVVARYSTLQVFTVKSLTSDFSFETNNKNENGDAPNSRFGPTKLVLVTEYHLAGTVTGLARIKTRKSRSGGELLLVATKDAKLSLTQWDPVACTLETISLHYYEQEDLLSAPWSPPLGSFCNYLVSDPGSRCAALKFGIRNLAILPFKPGDDDVEMDGWGEDDGARQDTDVPDADAANGASNNKKKETPYSASFVLRLPNLDQSLQYPVHLAFLHEYHEPTFGIITSSMGPSHQLGLKDNFHYMVFTLDLQQKASTTILSVSDLPQDLFRVVALPAPIGGALLVGMNELIHVDQSGKTNGVAVNPFAKQCTNFTLADQSSLNMKLEHCQIELLSAETAEMLMVLFQGEMAIIKFQVDGRSVVGIHIHTVTPDAGSSIIQTRVSSLTKLGRNTMFVASERSDSLVLGWTRKQTNPGKKRHNVIDLGIELDESDLEEDDEEDDDDLYAETSGPIQFSADIGSTNSGDVSFKIHDRLLCIAPIRDVTIGKAQQSEGEIREQAREVTSDLHLVCASGRGTAGAMTVITKDIKPITIGGFSFPEARGVWTLRVRKPVSKADKGKPATTTDKSTRFDRFMIVSKVDLDGYHTSSVYGITSDGFETLTATEFDPAAGFTVEAGTMGDFSRIVQVLKSEVRCYDGNLGLAQILPLHDEESNADPSSISASIEDPFLLIMRDDHTVYVASIDKYMEIEELEKPAQLSNTKWISGCLYKDMTGMFISDAPSDKNVVMFLLSSSGDLSLYTLPDFNHIWTRSDVCYVPPTLGGDSIARRGQAKETIMEILVANLGDLTDASPHLIVRNSLDDLSIYAPWRVVREDKACVEFHKISNQALARAPEPRIKRDDDGAPELVERFLPMRRCTNIGGYSCVFLPGPSPSFIMKSSKSLPCVLRLHGRHIRSMSPFHTAGCNRGFITIDNQENARVCQFPRQTSFAELGVVIKKIPVHAEIANIAYHSPTSTYLIACTKWEDFELPKDDDYHKEWQKETSLPMPPQVERSTIKLLSAKKWSEIHSIQLDPCEVVVCMESLNLEVSEETHERRHLLCVGTAILRGEDLPVRGRVYVYDVVNVIPQPDRPETNRGLKLIAREDIPRGAVTALSEIGTQGLMLVAQGQKCMVRGLKEDGTLLPVAFMDMSCHVVSAKELKSTGYCVMADAFKGAWFVGYSEEPYKMQLFGKSATKLECTVADFLPDGKDLYIVVADYDGGLNILQFDPEHPKSLQGHLLVHITTFCTGSHTPSHMLLLPATTNPVSPQSTASSQSGSGHYVLLMASSSSGQISLITPLNESSYLRLSSLTTQLINNLSQYLGLNPKAYRLPGSTGAYPPPPGVDSGLGRSIVDGAVLARWNELGSGRRVEIAGRAGFSGVDEVRAVLGGALGWGCLGYF